MNLLKNDFCALSVYIIIYLYNINKEFKMTKRKRHTSPVSCAVEVAKIATKEIPNIFPHSEQKSLSPLDIQEPPYSDNGSKH